MKLEELTEEMQKMENFYGKKLSEEEEKEWIKNFIKIDLKRFKYLVSRIYKEEKFMPKLSEMIEKNRNLGFVESNQVEKPYCKKCKNTGYVTYTKVFKDYISLPDPKTGKTRIMDYKAEYMAVCDCGRQQQYKSDRYYMPKASEIGL